MTQHTFKRYDDELNELKERVLAMGGLVERAIRRSMKALNEFDIERARKVVSRDKAINALEVEIDEMTRAMLALRQPAAGDLRFIISTIKIVTDLERSGDLAESIAEAVLQNQDNPLTHLDSMNSLSDAVCLQVSAALDAFARGDVEAALACVEGAKKIHKLFKAMQRENLSYMIEDPRKITVGMTAFSIGRSLVRIGDHAANVSEMVIYMVKGHDIRHVDHETAAALISGKLPDND
ncbi:MAG: phosphate transport system regulatory protein PhoU [Zetaproteobacteria bacterium CG12_big_fil_rev_8_21_14_0_65_55_1124]|nr:MAG: phosphate transport system regulatory protein PhoU [Zetaproteobacteria bacterium CG1_02_55_237]PIS18614.1 MAG: phosphate transport system regulatory protein PhoU [Zetaproteobacteria bacterium CG08_land_8_20_14_0_20_55_17]PIW43310.1 MAG: phosphate transport system regulatory protein PhoU [Zetaproteobacteria bacterium CG12_big_fil_rev_8_21_14_0_65_55_1124]PIY53044.1 MAG: phosphate transport system regulatory protein PhoU [Zetaproteobacteria bacterium CG_4_10_14_0_8_um_filter_55_43]PIZ3747